MTYNDKSNDSFKARLRFYYFHCILEQKKIDKTDFLKFDIDKGIPLNYVNLYITEYQQFKSGYVIENQVDELDNNAIYHQLQKLIKNKKSETNKWREQYRTEVFSKKISKEEFQSFVEKEACYYCGITKGEIDQLATAKQLFKKVERGFNLELDRLSPNKEYSFDN